MATDGLHLMEVFPALALASFDDSFFGRLQAPRYNPARRKTFRTESWLAVISAARQEATHLGCEPLVLWLDGFGCQAAPRKADQDRLDAAICLLIAIRWRLSDREKSVVLGDLRTGYIVAPVSLGVMRRLLTEAGLRGVPVDSTL
jgi:predicted RNase H-like nuclease